MKEQYGLYPKMQPQDFIKLAYQSEFGGGHLIEDEAKSRNIWRRKSGCYRGLPKTPMGGYWEWFLPAEPGCPWISKDGLDHGEPNFYFICPLAQGSRSSCVNLGKSEIFAADILWLSHWRNGIGIEGYRSMGYPVLHHSEVYNRSISPITASSTSSIRPLYQFSEIDHLLRSKPMVKVAIDGWAGRGRPPFPNC